MSQNIKMPRSKYSEMWYQYLEVDMKFRSALRNLSWIGDSNTTESPQIKQLKTNKASGSSDCPDGARGRFIRFFSRCF